jgi:hypothetical protein
MSSYLLAGSRVGFLRSRVLGIVTTCPTDQKGANYLMNTTLYRMTLPALLLATTPSLLMAAPLKVGRVTGDTHCNVISCPHCGHAMAIAQASDYVINFAADSIHPKTGQARFTIGVTDPAGKPVTDARVTLVLSMPAHEHGPRTVPVSGGKRGQYVAVTFVTPAMRGQWTAEVKVTTPGGKSATQAFTFEQ